MNAEHFKPYIKSYHVHGPDERETHAAQHKKLEAIYSKFAGEWNFSLVQVLYFIHQTFGENANGLQRIPLLEEVTQVRVWAAVYFLSQHKQWSEVMPQKVTLGNGVVSKKSYEKPAARTISIKDDPKAEDYLVLCEVLQELDRLCCFTLPTQFFNLPAKPSTDMASLAQ